MSEISTRIWLDERLWDQVRRRAIAEGQTARELIPKLLGQVLGTVPEAPQRGATVPVAIESRPQIPAGTEPGPPVVVLSEVYRCDVCGTQVRLGGLSNHLGKHLKEQQASDAERS